MPCRRRDAILASLPSVSGRDYLSTRGRAHAHPDVAGGLSEASGYGSRWPGPGMRRRFSHFRISGSHAAAPALDVAVGAVDPVGAGVGVATGGDGSSDDTGNEGTSDGTGRDGSSDDTGNDGTTDGSGSDGTTEGTSDGNGSVGSATDGSG